MPHTDTNISRNALGQYGLQPSRTDYRRRIQIYGDETSAPNVYKVYVDVLAEFTKDGILRPCRITWEDGRKYAIDRIRRCERRASRKAGGMGIMYTCLISVQEVNLFYEENMRWFVTRKTS